MAVMDLARQMMIAWIDDRENQGQGFYFYFLLKLSLDPMQTMRLREGVRIVLELLLRGLVFSLELFQEIGKNRLERISLSLSYCIN